MADLSDNTNWFETDASNNKASPNGWPEGMMPSGVNDTARADKGALKRFWDRINPVQRIAPLGGVWTFITSNTAYPTVYVNSEIYCFHAVADSVGGDQFAVNELGPKPIWKELGGGFWGPIVAQDIRVAGNPVLTFDGGLNAGSGAFLLNNPFVPISGDGSGGITTSSITVSGNINGYALSANGIGYPIGEGHGIAFGWNGTNLIAHVDGTNTPGALATAASLGNYLPLSGGTVTGNLGVSGNLTTGGVFTVDGLELYNNAGYLYSTAALLAPGLVSDGDTITSGTSSCANLTASNDVDASGVFRHSGAAGARIECFGGNWGFMTFAISSGSLVISPDNGSSGFIFGPGTGFSDARLKDNIHDTKVDALAAICATPVREFEWNEEGRKLMPHIDPMVPCGLVAQELEETMPFAVGVAPLADGMRHIIDQNVTPYLMRAIQQLETRVTELEGRLARE